MNSFFARLTRRKLALISGGRVKKEGFDAWIVFTREGALDPLAGEFGLEACTWKSAGILTRENETIAVLGSYDVKQVERFGIYDQVLGYGSEGASTLLASLSSSKGFETVAVNESQDYGLADGLTAGMKEVPFKEHEESKIRLLGGSCHRSAREAASRRNFKSSKGG